MSTIRGNNQHIMNKNTHHKSESGQIIIIVAFLMIAMIAMLGLAIDGGGLMFLQRDVQNAGDAAVLAATYAQCSGGDATQITNAAVSAAKEQGFENGVDGVIVTVDTNYTPPGGAASGVSYIKVDITAPKETFFIQIVHNQPLQVTAGGVGRCDTNSSSSTTVNRALVAACVGSSTGIEIQASNSCSGEVVGGMHTNSDGKSNGGLCGEGEISASGSAGAFSGTYDTDGDGNDEALPGAATSGAPVGTLPNIWNMSDFNSATAKYPARIISQWGSDNYGILPGGLSIKVDQIPSTFASYGLADPTVEPVLIYTNGNFEIKGGKNSGTLYLTVVATGQIEMTGNIKNWNFVNAGKSPAGNWASGSSANGMDYLFMYSGVTNSHSGDCKASGQGSAAIGFSMNDGYFEGILYAPDGDVRVSASSSHTSYGAIWAQSIKYAVSGMSLIWDPNLLPPEIVPPVIGVAQ